MLNPTIRSKRVFTAENALKDAMADFIIFPYDFPSAATRSIPSLFLALELLLREYALREPSKFHSQTNMVELITDHFGAVTPESDVLHWLRKKRNSIEHSGEVEWEEKTAVDEYTKRALYITAKLYISLGFSLEEYFSKWEHKLLNGEHLLWFEEADALIQNAVRICDTSPESAVNIATTAYKMALQGLGRYFYGNRADQFELAELFEKMSDDYSNFEINVGFYADKRTRYENEGELRKLDGIPVIEYSEILEIYRSDVPLGVRNHIHTMREIVESYIEKAEFCMEELIKLYWNAIINQLRRRNSKVFIPRIDWNESDLSVRRSDHWEILLPKELERDDGGWGVTEFDEFVNILRRICRDLPEDIKVSFYNPPSFKGISDLFY